MNTRNIATRTETEMLQIGTGLGIKIKKSENAPDPGTEAGGRAAAKVKGAVGSRE